jgi:putative transposase
MHPTRIHTWKKQLLAGADQLFSNGGKPASTDAEAPKAELFEQSGRLKMELEWLKKSRAARLSSGGRWSRLITPNGVCGGSVTCWGFAARACTTRRPRRRRRTCG